MVFMFCSALPDSYQDTTRQYLDNIDDITKYKLQPIIDRVIQEESRRKARNANASGSSSTIHKFSTTKKYEKHCVKCGKNNHNTRDHWDTPPQRQGGGSSSGGGSKKKSGQQKKKGGSTAKGKKPAVLKPIACMLSGGKAPRLSEVHCDRDSVCVKTDT